MVDDKGKTFVPRISQLDSVVFDDEIRNLLTTQLVDIGAYLKPGALNNVKPEINLLIGLLVYKYSILRTNSTFGQQLLGLKYSEKLSKKLAWSYAVLNYGVPYIKHRYEETLSSLMPNTVKNLIFDKAELVVKALCFINILSFIQVGKYPTLVDRLLGLQYAPVTKLQRSVGYSYMTRELLWHGFMELLMFTLPLINYQSVKRQLRSLLPVSSDKGNQQHSAVCDISTVCCVCQQSPTLPCRVSLYCSHVSCYYCLKANITADEKFQCPTCGVGNTACHQLQFL